MKWFKHMSDAHRDPKLIALVDEFGVEGYGMWWILCEVVADQFKAKGTPELETSIKGWRTLTGIYPKKFKKLLTFLEKADLLSVTFSEKAIKVCLPKMQELKDNYTKNLQATGNSTRARTPEAEGEKENKKEEGALPRSDFGFGFGRDGSPIELKMPVSDGTLANITSKTLDQWEKSFRFVDVRGSLATLIGWFEESENVGKQWDRKGWFNACAGWLAKKSNKTKLEMSQRDPNFDPNDPDGSKAALAQIKQRLAKGASFQGEA